MTEPLTPEEEVDLRKMVAEDAEAVWSGRTDWEPMEWRGPVLQRLLATLDRERAALPVPAPPCVVCGEPTPHLHEDYYGAFPAPGRAALPVPALNALRALGHEPAGDGDVCLHRWRNRTTRAVHCRFLAGWRAALGEGPR